MPLSASEIRLGAVAYFDVHALNSDARLTTPAFPTTRPGPFVCFQTDGTRSAWAPLTTQFKDKRVEIRPSSRSGGSPTWQSDPIYLNDGACTYVGPDEAFIDATALELPFVDFSRPEVSLDAVRDVCSAVSARRGSTL